MCVVYVCSHSTINGLVLLSQNVRISLLPALVLFVIRMYVMLSVTVSCELADGSWLCSDMFLVLFLVVPSSVVSVVCEM